LIKTADFCLAARIATIGRWLLYYNNAKIMPEDFALHNALQFKAQKKRNPAVFSQYGKIVQIRENIRLVISKKRRVKARPWL
jgi:hypothetical protein